MTKRTNRKLGGRLTVDGIALIWNVKSEPAWGTTHGDIGLRLSVMKHDETLTRHGVRKAWRELVLQFPFERQRHPSRFPEKPKVTSDMLTAGVRLAIAAGWSPDGRGRPFELILEESDLP
ncbi:MAG: hypothetical protein JF627_08840 [Alphaproteobacteria bacterium]|jgi:hypothetical protein|nr:hypothetical protein [Alphaproteobacteria bacterium]